MLALSKKLLGVFGISSSPTNIIVDYDSPPYIPRGADCVSAHEPIGSGKMTIDPQRIQLLEIPFGMTGEEFKSKAPKNTRFCDAKVLDALTVDNVTRDNKLIDPIKAKKKIALLGDGEGPVYFLGTTFMMCNEDQEAVGILNRGSLPALRYLIRLKQPITCLEALINPKNYAAVYSDQF